MLSKQKKNEINNQFELNYTLLWSNSFSPSVFILFAPENRHTDDGNKRTTESKK